MHECKFQKDDSIIILFLHRNWYRSISKIFAALYARGDDKKKKSNVCMAVRSIKDIIMPF